MKRTCSNSNENVLCVRGKNNCFCLETSDQQQISSVIL